MSLCPYLLSLLTACYLLLYTHLGEKNGFLSTAKAEKTRKLIKSMGGGTVWRCNRTRAAVLAEIIIAGQGGKSGCRLV